MEYFNFLFLELVLFFEDGKLIDLDEGEDDIFYVEFYGKLEFKIIFVINFLI